jgi:hypothetical protein
VAYGDLPPDRSLDMTFDPDYVARRTVVRTVRFGSIRHIGVVAPVNGDSIANGAELGPSSTGLATTPSLPSQLSSVPR